jgi:hypothetical protein
MADVLCYVINCAWVVLVGSVYFPRSLMQYSLKRHLYTIAICVGMYNACGVDSTSSVTFM